MLNTQYQQTISTLVDYTVLSTNDLIIVGAGATAIRTLTLPLARQSGGDVYIYNASAFPATIAVQSGDTLRGAASVAPGAMVHYQAALTNTWYSFSGGGVTGGQQSVVKAVSSSALLAIRTTPLVLVPAGPSGSCVVIDNISFKMTTTATQYTNGGALEFRYTGTSGTKVSADIAAAVVTTTAGVSFTNVRGIEASLTGTVDAAVVMTAASADFAAGTGVGVVTVFYHYV